MNHVRRHALAVATAFALASLYNTPLLAQPQVPAGRTAGTPFLADSIVGLKVGGWGPNTPNQGKIDGADRANGLTDTASVVFLQEYESTGGSFARRLAPIVMPYVATASGNRALTMASNSGSEGALRRSADGQYLTMAGYNQSQPESLITRSVPSGSSAPLSAATDAQGAKFDPAVVNRTLGRVDAVGNVNTTTTMNNAYSGDNIRSAVSLDGQQFWTSGNIAGGSQNATGGVRYATLGGTSSVQIDGSGGGGLSTSNINRVDIQNGQLYASSRNNSNNGIWAIGTGTPTSAVNGTRLFDYNALVSAATSRTPGTSSATANFQGPYDFFFSNENTIYVADSILGISKFTRNQAGTWGYSYTFARTGGVQNDGSNGGPKQAGGTTGMAGRVLSNGSVMLFGTGGFSGTPVLGSLDTFGGNYLFAIEDTGANADLMILDIAAANEHFKGVALAPLETAVVPVPPAVALMLGGLGLLGASSWRRRRAAAA
jgi:hypothetical protein